MRNAVSLPEREVDLNRKLGRCVVHALWELRDSDEGFDFTPNLDGLNQPYMDDETRSTRDRNRPDLQWILKNSQPRTIEEHFRSYAMECKRLGTPSSSTWILNEQYISSGVCRFIKAKYGYGSPKYNPSYAMIGYVQNMELADILNEVNEAAIAFKKKKCTADWPLG